MELCRFSVGQGDGSIGVFGDNVELFLAAHVQSGERKASPVDTIALEIIDSGAHRAVCLHGKFAGNAVEYVGVVVERLVKHADVGFVRVAVHGGVDGCEASAGEADVDGHCVGAGIGPEDIKVDIDFITLDVAGSSVDLRGSLDESAAQNKPDGVLFSEGNFRTVPGDANGGDGDVAHRHIVEIEVGQHEIDGALVGRLQFDRLIKQDIGLIGDGFETDIKLAVIQAGYLLCHLGLCCGAQEAERQ